MPDFRRFGQISAALGLALLASAFTAPSARASGCITRLPISITFPTSYADGYVDHVEARVASKGPSIRFLHVGIYTFGGLELARAHVRGTVTQSPQPVHLKMRFGRLQAGRFTVYASGEPNRSRSCGPKHYSRIHMFRPCPWRLPVRFPQRPGGPAFGFGDHLPVLMEPLGPVLSDLTVTVRSASGQPVGQGRLPILFGRAPIVARLRGPLAAGRYVAVVRGRIDRAPGCGHPLAPLSFGLS